MCFSIMIENDAAACASLFTEVYTGAPWNHTCVTVEKAARYIADLMHTPGFIGFVYKDGDTLAGMLLGTVNDYFFDPQYKIEELAVAHAYRRQGMGTRLLCEAETYLRKQGVAYILLQTSREIPAFGFYEKNGYAEVDATASMAKGLI